MTQEVNILSKDSFEFCPVWKWNSCQEGYLPVLDWQSSKINEPTLFIKAKFVSFNGFEMQGYIVGLYTFFAFTLFIGDEGYGFNLNLPDMAESTLLEIKKISGFSGIELFPLAYESGVELFGKKRIQGVLNLGKP